MNCTFAFGISAVKAQARGATSAKNTRNKSPPGTLRIVGTYSCQAGQPGIFQPVAALAVRCTISTLAVALYQGQPRRQGRSCIRRCRRGCGRWPQLVAARGGRCPRAWDLMSSSSSSSAELCTRGARVRLGLDLASKPCVFNCQVRIRSRANRTLKCMCSKPSTCLVAENV